MPRKIEFLFDFASPNCYVAFHRLRQLSDSLRAEVTLVPIFLGGIFKATGDSVLPPDSLEFKYMVHNLKRHANDLRIPLVLPDSFPVNAVRSLRGVLYAMGMNNPATVERYVESVFHAHWGLGLNISNEQILAEIARKYFDEKRFLEYIQSQEAKDLLRAETDKALERGVFGAPTLFVDDAMYWGTPEILWYLEQRMAKKAMISEPV